jgi:hypothetical protein
MREQTTLPVVESILPGPIVAYLRPDYINSTQTGSFDSIEGNQGEIGSW